MWTASQMKESTPVTYHGAQLGMVTSSGEENGVCLGTERRWLPVMAPGGYRWQPRTGDTVLVLKAGDAGELPCILAAQASNGTPLQPGEVELAGPGCGIKLAAGGTLALQGKITVNGTPLDEYIRSIASTKQGG